MNTKSEIRTKPQFSWYRAYSKDAPSQTQLLFQSHSDAVNHLKLLRMYMPKSETVKPNPRIYKGDIFKWEGEKWIVIDINERKDTIDVISVSDHLKSDYRKMIRMSIKEFSKIIFGYGYKRNPSRNPASGIPLWLWITGAGLTAGGIYWYYKSKKE